MFEPFEKVLAKMAVKSPNKFLMKLIPPNYLYRKGSIRIAERDGINYRFDISDSVDHFIYFGFKEENIFEPVFDIIKKAEVIFDIGANIGATSMYLAKLNSSAKIFSFEPHPESFNKAQENLKLNNFQNITYLDVALGEKEDNFKLYEVNSANAGMNRFMSDDKNFPFENVRVKTLDNVMKEKEIKRADFIKIDVEGFEYFVLKGSVETIKQFHPVMVIELNDNNIKANNISPRDVIELLNSLGYDKIVIGETLEPVYDTQDFTDCFYDIIAY